MSRRGTYLILSLVIFFFIVPVTLRAETPPVNPGFYGYPIDYARVAQPDFPFPDVEGVIVTEVEGGRFVGLAGMRRGDIVREVQGEKIRELHDVREILNRSRGETVSFKVEQLSPRYEMRRREDPFYRPRENPYRENSFTVEVPTYTPPEPEPVIEGESGRFYHCPDMEHSPDTTVQKMFEDRSDAEEAGLRPCPICYEDEGPVVDALVQTPIDVSGEEESLPGTAEGRSDLPEDLRKAMETIFPLRLRRHIEPSVQYLEEGKLIGYSTPGGDFKISRGLWELMESKEEQLFLIAYLQAHFDRRHEPDPDTRRYFYELLEEAIQRTTGTSFHFGQLREMSRYSPGYFVYQQIVDKGYGREPVEDAFLFAQIYLKRAGYDNSGIKKYLAKIRDMEFNPHSKWLDYLFQHPVNINMEDRIEKWAELIDEHF